jgi:hypothetical protein
MAEDRIDVDTGTGELLCEIRGRVALITRHHPSGRWKLGVHAVIKKDIFAGGEA